MTQTTRRKKKEYKPVAPITIITAIDQAWMEWYPKAETDGGAYPRNFFMEIPSILAKKRLDVFRRPR